MELPFIVCASVRLSSLRNFVTMKKKEDSPFANRQSLTFDRLRLPACDMCSFQLDAEADRELDCHAGQQLVTMRRFICTTSGTRRECLSNAIENKEVAVFEPQCRCSLCVRHCAP